jgi:hypothetical protein
MTHPYHQHKEVKAGHKRAKEMSKHFKSGGAVKLATGGAVTLKRGGKAKHEEVKAEGKASGGRLDKRARGGGTKKHGKGHHTHINIMVAPKGGDGAPPPGLGGGGPPIGGAPPMVPKAPMGPPIGGPMGAGPPGLPPPGAAGPPKPPGMMERGGKVYSGISSKANIDKWADRASSNTRYASGGVVDGAIAPFKPPHMKGGAGGARGRLDKEKSYGLKPNTKGS